MRGEGADFRGVNSAESPRRGEDGQGGRRRPGQEVYLTLLDSSQRSISLLRKRTFLLSLKKGMSRAFIILSKVCLLMRRNAMTSALVMRSFSMLADTNRKDKKNKDRDLTKRMTMDDNAY